MTAEVQVNDLIYHMGDQADNILTSFGLYRMAIKKMYDMVKEKFEKQFIKCQNKIYERAKFNQRRQLPSIISLHSCRTLQIWGLA